MKTAQRFSDDLHELAQWYREHPDAPVPSDMSINLFVDSKDELARIGRMLSPCAKGGNDEWFWLSRRFGALRLDFNVPRNVACVRRVVGTELVPAQTLEAYTREVVEWDCDPILEPSEEPQ